MGIFSKTVTEILFFFQNPFFVGSESENSFQDGVPLQDPEQFSLKTEISRNLS